MYLVYVDESGDPGLPGDTPFFVISGIIVHESRWNDVFHRFMELRRNLSLRYGIPQRTMLHATDMVNGHGDFHHTAYGLKRPQRFEMYRESLEFLSQLDSIRILNVFVRKDHINRQDSDVFLWAWQMFIQRFHNFLEHGGCAGGGNEFGLLFTDRTHDDQLRRLLRKMRAFNLVPSQYGSPSRRILVTRILDDPVSRVASSSYYVQMADLVAFALARRDYRRPSIAKFGFERYFDILTPVLLKEASQYNAQGIVYWPR